MARRKKGEAAEEEEPTVDISSLIDVCFLLLIYFIVTQTITLPESDLKLQLPNSNSTSDEKPKIDPAFFFVHSDGSIDQVVSGALSPLADAGDPDVKHREPDHPGMVELNNAVAAYVGIAKDEAVIKVKAEPDVKAQYVVDLMNMLAHHGITKITFTKIFE